ncbi:MAG: DUF370 domain-containing protein [Oscillospiraceae bacterium]
MYVHIGQNNLIPAHSLIGIFDLDNASWEKTTRDYLTAAQEEGVVVDACDDIPRSFLVCDHPYHRQIVYLSQLSSAALARRAESEQLEL